MASFLVFVLTRVDYTNLIKTQESTNEHLFINYNSYNSSCFPIQMSETGELHKSELRGCHKSEFS